MCHVLHMQSRRVASLSTLGVGRTTWTILHSRLMTPQNRETILHHLHPGLHLCFLMCELLDLLVIAFT